MTETSHHHSPAAGWFPDPAPGPRYRWWDGRNWTAQVFRPNDLRTQIFTEQPPEAAAQAGPKSAAPAARTTRKWLGPAGGWIIVAGFLAIWLFQFGIGFALRPIEPHTTDPAASVIDPFLLLTGSSAVAVGLMYTAAYRLLPQDRISAGRLIVIAVLGGGGAALLAAPINSVIDFTTGGSAVEPSVTALAMSGPVEEFAKIALVILLAWRLPVKNARTGLFVGGAVGFGFSVIEDIQYVEMAWARGLADHRPVTALILVVLLRQAINVFTHPMWTALLAAAVFAAARNGRFRLTAGVFGAYLAIAAAHSLYDSAGNLATLLVGPEAAGLVALPLILLLFAATALVWFRVALKYRPAAAVAAP